MSSRHTVGAQGDGPTPPRAEPEAADAGLGPDWVLDSDGLYFRRGARVILLDDHDRVLLLRGHDVDQPERSWWFTIGGGVEPGESDRAAAVRELREETGLVLAPGELVGPVFTRSAIFDFFRRTCRQDEVLFLARVAGDDVGVSSDGWTEVERDVVDELRWWALEDLRRVEIEVFPEGLADLTGSLLAGWDGVTRHLGVQSGFDQGGAAG